MVANTSMLAFRTRVMPHLSRNEEVVYDAIAELGIATNDEVAAHLGWPIHCVTGRTNALWKKSLIARVDRDGVSAMGNRAKRWGIKDFGDRQLKMFAEQECEE